MRNIHHDLSPSGNNLTTREEDLLLYEHVDLTGGSPSMLDRDEFNFAVGKQFGEVPTDKVRQRLTEITVEQKRRRPVAKEFVQRPARD